MSTIASRRILWVVLLFTLPIPMWFLGGGRVPTFALLQITAYLIPVWLAEGGPGAQLAFLGFAVQGLVWLAVLYGVSRVIAGLLARVGGGRVPVAGVALVVVALVVVSLFQVYKTPVIARGAPVNLLGVY